MGLSPLTNMFAQNRPQRISGGLSTATRAATSPAADRQNAGDSPSETELVDAEEPEQGPEGPKVGRRDQVLAPHIDGPVVKAQRLDDVDLQIADQEEPDRCERVKLPRDHLEQEVQHDHTRPSHRRSRALP